MTGGEPQEVKSEAVRWAEAVATGYSTVDAILVDMARLARQRRDGRWTLRCKETRFLKVVDEDEMHLSWSIWALGEFRLVTQVGEPGGIQTWILNVGAKPDEESFLGRPAAVSRTDNTRAPVGFTGWARLSDELDEHPKVINLLDEDAGAEAMALWMLAFTWFSRARRTERADRIPHGLPGAKLPGIGGVAAKRLVEAGLWIEVDGGWQFDESDELFVWGPIEERRSWIPGWLRRLVYERDGYQCVRCGSEDDLTLDHIIPWSSGGADEESNLQTMCRSCNSSKGARV